MTEERRKATQKNPESKHRRLTVAFTFKSKDTALMTRSVAWQICAH